MKAEAYMENINQQFRLIFKAKHSSAGGVQGDIALDDYTIGGCKPSKGRECIRKDLIFFSVKFSYYDLLLPSYPYQSDTWVSKGLLNKIKPSNEQ